MWNSVPLLQTIASASLIVALVGGVVAAGAGAIGTWASNRAADIQKLESDQRVAFANQRAAEANARAEEAKAAAALAHERLQKAQAARHLSKAQMDSLAPLLRSDWFQKEPKPTLRVSSVEDAEARMYAMEWQNFLQSHGIQIYPTDGGLPSTCVQLAPNEDGLVLTVKSLDTSVVNQPFTRFHQAIIAVGFPHKVEIDTTLHDRENASCMF